MPVVPRCRNPPPGQSSSRVLKLLQRPFQNTKGAPQTSPPLYKEFLPRVSSKKTVWREGREKKREDTTLETSDKDVLSIPWGIPMREESQTWTSFGRTGKCKAEPKGQHLDPSCLATKVGQFLFAQKSILMDTRTSLLGWPEGKVVRTDRWQLRWCCLGEVALTCSRSESAPCTELPASSRTCLVLCHSAVSERAEASVSRASFCVHPQDTLPAPRRVTEASPSLSSDFIPRAALEAETVGEAGTSGAQFLYL